jgi:hypothetical protein
MVHSELHDRPDWLLIFDGVDKASDEIRPFLHLGGRVLATSRLPELPGFKNIPIRPLRRKQSVELLSGLVPNLAAEDADRISAATGDLPLAMAIVAGHFRQHPDLDAETFLQKLRTDRNLMPTASTGDILPTVRRTLDSALDRLAGESQAALQLLTSVAWLAPGPVPLSLFTKWTAAVLPTPLGQTAADPLALADVLSLVAMSSLASVAPGSLTLHDLVSQVLRETTASARVAGESWPANIIRLLRAALPDEPDERSQPWEQLLTHVLFATNPKQGLDEVAGDVAWLLDRAARYLELTDQVRRADEIRDRATTWLGSRSVRAAQRHLVDIEHRLELMRARLPSDHPDVLAIMSELAAALHEAGRYKEARQLSEHVFRRRSEGLG